MEIEPGPVDKRVKQSREIVKWFFAISVVLMAISIVATFNSTGNSEFSVEDYLATEDYSALDSFGSDTSWVPSGYQAWSSDSSVAWKWSSKSNCDYYSCISAEIISRDGCPSGLYAALNWLDNNDSVVSYSNESLPSLLPMQAAKLRFDDIQETGDSGQMAEINCY